MGGFFVWSTVYCWKKLNPFIEHGSFVSPCHQSGQLTKLPSPEAVFFRAQRSPSSTDSLDFAAPMPFFPACDNCDFVLRFFVHILSLKMKHLLLREMSQRLFPACYVSDVNLVAHGAAIAGDFVQWSWIVHFAVTDGWKKVNHFIDKQRQMLLDNNPYVKKKTAVIPADDQRWASSVIRMKLRAYS